MNLQEQLNQQEQLINEIDNSQEILFNQLNNKKIPNNLQNDLQNMINLAKKGGNVEAMANEIKRKYGVKTGK